MEQTKETEATLDVIIEALIAISVVSKGLAKKAMILSMKEKEKEGKKDEK